MIRVVLFDAGDILYTRPRRGRRLREILDKAGVRGIDRSDPRWVALKKAAHIGALSERTYYTALVDLMGIEDPGLRREALDSFYEDQRDIEFTTGVRETLRQLKSDGYRLGIITNTIVPTREKLRWFSEVGIDDVWDVFVTSCEVHCVKPDPRAYLMALEAVDALPREAVFVGHAREELLGAENVWMRALVFNYDDNASRFPVAASFSQIPVLVAR